MRVGELPQLVLAEAVCRLGDEFPAGKLRFVDDCGGPLLAARALDLELAHLARQPLVFRLQLLDGGAPAIRGCSERTQQIVQHRARMLMVLYGTGTGDRLDPPDARRDSAL